MSTESQTKTMKPALAPRGAARPMWWRVYFLLAAFDLLTISFSLNLNHRLMNIHEESVRINHEWASQLNRISDLAQLGGAVNAPGNDVFDSREVDKESASLRQALAVFETGLAETEQSLLGALKSTDTNTFRGDLTQVRVSMQEMVGEADLIFSHFREGHPEKAGERMATMDRKYAKLNSGFAELGRHIREIQAVNFSDQKKQSAALRRYEFLIAGAIVFMVLAVAWYGHRITTVMAAAMDEKEQYLADLHEARDGLEQRVHERTLELRQEIRQREEAQNEALRTHEQLVNSSRLAGMAEVANNVLHNVGNVLNSVNVSSGQIAGALRQSSASDVRRVADLLRQHESDLGHFLTNNPKGRQIPAFLGQLAEVIEQEHQTSLTELESLSANVDHIKQIISMQQGFARPSGGLQEMVLLPELFEQALAINLASLDRHQIDVVREFSTSPAIMVDRHQVLQILVNLIGNAKQAMLSCGGETKRLSLRTLADPARPEFVSLQVADTGMGIKPEHLPRIFAQGFTTKKDGHGFGLHSSALSAKSMGGSLEVRSDGEGCGAVFTLHLPAPAQTLAAAA